MNWSFTSFSTPQLGLEDMLRAAVRYGYGGVEPRMDARHAHGIEAGMTPLERKKARDLAARHGVTLCCLATSLSYADPSSIQDRVEQTYPRIDLASDLGIALIRVFGGKRPDGVSRSEATGVMAAALRGPGDYAAEKGVALCVETHDDWCDPQDVETLMRETGHPAVGVVWDIMHPVRAGFGSIESSFKRLEPYIRHVHVHDGIWKDNSLSFVPVGSGAVDHLSALNILRRAGYTGFLSGEWINWEPWETHLPGELNTLRAYEKRVS